nr:reverse transcriptase domain-containing protein [Tanacetum cinerariifolium]
MSISQQPIHEEMDGVMHDTNEDDSINGHENLFAALDHVAHRVVDEDVVEVVVEREEHTTDKTRVKGAARRWQEKEPPHAIHTWEYLVSKFINEFFPPQEQQISVMKSLIFNNADQDSLNAAAGGNLLERRTQDVLTIIENKSKVRNSRNKSVVSQVKSCDANSNSSSEIAKLTHAVNQQTSAVTTAMKAILKQFQATLPPASVKAVEETCVTCAAAVNYNQGNYGYRPPEETLTDPDLAEYTIKVPPPPLHINITLADALIRMPKYQKMLKALLSNKEKLQELANTPLNENCSAVILKKLPEKLGDSGKFLIPCGFSELKCKALADLADFVIVDYESDSRVPLILGRPFLQITRALIDVHGEEMILRDGDERLTLNMRHDTSSYSNQPQKESINLINVFNHSKGSNVLSKKLLDLDSTKDLHPPLHVNPLSGSTTYSSNPLLDEFADELALITFPLKYDDYLQFDIESDLKEIEFLLQQDIDSSLNDLIDQSNLANPADIFVDSMPEMFTDEHAPDYSSPPIFDEYDDDF